MISVQIKKSFVRSNSDFSLDAELIFEEGKFYILTGKSGSGKTSILRFIAGLLEADNGLISIDDQFWYHTSKGINISPQVRNIGFLFQDYALFPHLTVKRNIEYGLGKNGLGDYERGLISLFEIDQILNQYPSELSGGQKQRVALARALVRKPQILLLDEPLNAVDASMRIRLQDHLLKLQKQSGFTIIMVSHDNSEILKLADYVYEMDQGKVLRGGKPAEYYGVSHLLNKFSFIGEIVAIHTQDIVSIIDVLISNNLVKVISDPITAAELKPGDQVMVASKGFNPVIQKISVR